MLQEAVDAYITSLSSGGDTGAGARERNNRNTIVAYRNDLNQFCSYLEQQGVASWPEMAQGHLAGYLLEMSEGQAYRSTTIARKLAAIKAFFRYIRSIALVPMDFGEQLETPRVQKALPQVLSAEQISSLFRQVEVETPIGQRDLAILHVLCTTGMRVTEITSLNVEDFDVAQATISCSGHNGRTKHERVLVLPTLALEAIQQYIVIARPRLMQRHPEEQALFLNHHGERLTRQGFWLIIKGYARAAGIREITPQMLRHSFALLMLSEGMELRAVQELLGHANIATTQVYTQLARVRTTTRV